MPTIVGNDLSQFQGNIDWNTYKNNSNFCIIKATEGVGYIDPKAGTYSFDAIRVNLPHGFYHFARPDLGNTAFEEANFFVKTITETPLIEGEVFALDFEVIYTDCVNWCLHWLQEVEKQTGVKPFIYLNQSTCQQYDWTPVINNGNALWIAAYTGDPNNNTFQGGAWQSAAMQQWTSTQTVPGIQGNVDGDVFFGTADQFKAYGYKPIVTPPDPCADIKTEYQTMLKEYTQYKLDHPTATPVVLPLNNTSGQLVTGDSPTGVKQAIITILKWLHLGV